MGAKGKYNPANGKPSRSQYSIFGDGEDKYNTDVAAYNAYTTKKSNQSARAKKYNDTSSTEAAAVKSAYEVAEGTPLLSTNTAAQNIEAQAKIDAAKNSVNTDRDGPNSGNSITDFLSTAMRFSKIIGAKLAGKAAGAETKTKAVAKAEDLARDRDKAALEAKKNREKLISGNQRNNIITALGTTLGNNNIGQGKTLLGQ